MAYFLYKVRTDKGEALKGKVEAQSKDQAVALLQERNWFVVSLNELQTSELNVITSMFDRVKFEDIVNFTRQLATMITAGLPLTEALSILQQQSKPALRKVVSLILKEIEGGSSLADAMQKQEGTVFSRVYVALIRAGEAAGVLDTILKRLADNLEKQREFRAKTKSALIYPAIVIIAMMVVGFIMMTVVVPKLTSMYADFGAELPLPTQILISISDLFVKFWYIIILLTIGGVFGIRSWKKTEQGARTFDGLLLKVPVIGVLLRQITLTEFTRTISLLLSAGISLLTALDIVADAMDNVLYREAVRVVAKDVEKGMSLADAIQKNVLFPPLLGQMVSVGEQTGKLDEVVLKISTFYESETEHAVKNLTTAIEPIIMVVLGVGVGFIMIAIIMPIYNLTSQF